MATQSLPTMAMTEPASCKGGPWRGQPELAGRQGASRSPFELEQSLNPEAAARG